MVVPTISVGETESYCILIAMTVVGIIVKPDVFRAKNVIIDRDAVSEPLNAFICSIALIPIGVAALPKPKIFAVKLDKIYPIAGWSAGMSGKIFETSGPHNFAKKSKIPVFSAISIMRCKKINMLLNPLKKVT